MNEPYKSNKKIGTTKSSGYFFTPPRFFGRRYDIWKLPLAA